MDNELENMTHQFVKFFKSKQKPPPEGTTKYRLRPQKGWLEEVRADGFGTLTPEQVSLREGLLWSKLSAKIFVVASMSISAILAYYDDGTILWLDDHESNDDFEAFAKNEHLWTWLPEHKEDLIELLIETKLNFFGDPQLINTISDIPSFSKENWEQMAKYPRLQSQLLEMQQHLENLSDKIIHPTLLSTSKDSFELTFFVWTHILGRIIQTRFEFGKDGSFMYEGNELLKEAGRFLVPR